MFNNKSSDTANHLIDHAVHSADAALHSASDHAHAVVRHGMDAVRETSNQVREGAQHASDRTVSYIREEPVKSMLIAAATGAALMALARVISQSGHSR